MSNVLIAYATNEGQTARIAGTLAKQIEANGHSTDVLDLGDTATPPDPAAYDGIVVAASVHAGKHQESAQRFVAAHRNALDAGTTAFLSVSLSAIAKATTSARSGTAPAPHRSTLSRLSAA